MPMHKLSEGPITLTVAELNQVEGKFGVQYRVTSVDGTDVYVNMAPFERQLGRLSLDVNSVIGKTIRMEHVEKNGTTFTNIALAPAGSPEGVSAPRAGAAPAHAPAMHAPTMTPAEAGALYAECVEQAMVAFGARMEAAGYGVTDVAVQAAAATIFIKISR